MQRKILTGMMMAVLSMVLMLPINAGSSNVLDNLGLGAVTVAATTTTTSAVKSGWKKESGKWFYYKSGKVLTGWQTIRSKTYYFQKTTTAGNKGKMLTGWQKSGTKWFYFGTANDGAMKTGWQKLNGKWYYLKKTGATGNKGMMLTGWQKSGEKYYYFGGANDGVLRIGWQTINKKSYYFRQTGGKGVLGENYRNGTYTINGKKHRFDASGECENPATSTSDVNPLADYILRKDPVDGKTWKVEPEFETDPQVGSKNITEEAFMAALIYTEGGDQGEAGQLMVAMCVMNRVIDKNLGYYPNSLKFVVYENGQYAVARKASNGGTGTLTKELKIIQEKGYTWWKKSFLTKAQCAKAAQKSFKIIADYKKNPKKNPRTINKTITKAIKAANKEYGVKDTTESTSFDHTFFMTPGAFNRMGLSSKKSEKFSYKGHVFFRYWKR